MTFRAAVDADLTLIYYRKARRWTCLYSGPTVAGAAHGSTAAEAAQEAFRRLFAATYGDIPEALGAEDMLPEDLL